MKKQFNLKQSSLNINQVINSIVTHMTKCKIQTLHPPFLQKSLTKYRRENFSFLKQKMLILKSQNKYSEAMKILHNFISDFDDKYCDDYIEQLRQPYIRKIFQDNYQFDNIDFITVNKQHKLKVQIQNVLEAAAQWLIEIELTQDLLDRINFYFDIKTPFVEDKLKQQGLKGKNNAYSMSFMSIVRKLSAYLLRKSSSTIKSSGYRTITSMALMVTFALMGGTANLPWISNSTDFTNLIPAFLAMTVPLIFEQMAEKVQRTQFQKLLAQWSHSFNKISQNIRKFNEMLVLYIHETSMSINQAEYNLHCTDIMKVLQTLSKNIQSVQSYDQQKYEQMRIRTQAYFRKYIEIEEGEWTIIMTSQQFDQFNIEKQKQQTEKKDQFQEI